MQSPEALANGVRVGWSSLLARATGAILLSELVSGLAITLGPFRAATDWGLLLHTVVGVVTLAPMAWSLVRHWKDYSDQALSDGPNSVPLAELEPIIARLLRMQECALPLDGEQ